ncbi:MAG TPA: Ig-like domain-containing protein [Longimicrobium sp.]|nr:Ig-like domain-containing protein [Longimicrobium sp.]
MRRLLTLTCALALLGACKDPTGDGKAGPPATMDAVSGDDQVATVGTELPQALVVRVLDEDGDPVPDQAVNFVVMAGGGSVSAGTVQTDDDGRAEARWTLGTAAGDSQYVHARAVDDGGQVLASAVFSAMGTPGNPAAITPVGPAARTGSSGQALADSLAVRVTDAHGNPVTGAAVVWSVRSGGGSISPLNTTTGAGGIARAAWTLGTRVDSVQVAQAAAGASLVAEFTAQAAPPLGTQIIKLSGDGQVGTVGQPLPQPLRIAVRTAAGQPIPGAQVAWSTSSNGGLTPATGVTDANGEAQAVWQLGAPSGPQFAFATVAGIGQVTFSAGSNPGPVAFLVKEDGDGQTAAAGSTLNRIVVSARDQYGNRVNGVPITWTVMSGGGAVDPPSSTTALGGFASTQWTLGPAGGTQTLRAHTGTVEPVTFTATATVNPNLPASLTLSHTAFTMSAAATENLHATIRNAAGAEITHNPTWSSTDPSVVEVRVPFPVFPGAPVDTRDVVAVGRAPGTARIIATTSNGKADTVEVTVVPLDLVSVEAGNSKSCGLSALAEALCWGSNSYFDLGTSPTAASVPRPVGVELDSTVTRLATSLGFHACALRASGKAFCWGINNAGQLGSGEPSLQYATPRPVAGGHTFTRVEAGGNHACALTAAGQAWCWGSGVWGQLGNGGKANSFVPVQVAGGHAFVELALGASHSCGLTAAGAVWCWGSNEYLQLGVATTTETCDGGVEVACSTTPVQVSGATAFASITASFWSSCGLTSGGAAHCWGSNRFGTLGNGGGAHSATPVPVSGGHAFSRLDGGGEAMCGVGAGGQAYCWGWTPAFGTPAVAVVNSPTPVPVGGALRFTSVSVVDHLCGMGTDGYAYCWGINGSGQVGDGTTTSRHEPVRVAGQGTP